MIHPSIREGTNESMGGCRPLGVGCTQKSVTGLAAISHGFVSVYHGFGITHWEPGVVGALQPIALSTHNLNIG